ncbi:SdpI family protein [Dyella jejuensis]|uniref:SdpI family protein n=1 Tax=Dyella jejuensis TaxID=1432009 RepID=A0ABW8JH23_9GAMM
MKPRSSWWISAVFLSALLAVFVWLRPRMPALVATHWNARGNVNGYMTPMHAVLVPTLAIVTLGLLTWLLPRISPRRYAIGPFVSAFAVVMLALQALVLVAALGVLLNAAGHPVRMPWLCMISLGALLLVMGNYMDKLRQNFFMGIRTPWTLASEAVWERTHRLSGWMFVLAGLAVIAIALLQAPLWSMLCVIAASVLVPCVYSYVIYQRLEQHG